MNILNKLKESPNWVQETKIWHNWDKDNNQVSFLYDYPDSGNARKDRLWEETIKRTINEYSKS